MDRPIEYSQEVIRSFDILWGYKDILKSLGFSIGDLLNGNQITTPTVVAGFTATQTATASLNINISAGTIYSVQQLDMSAYGSLSTDSLQLVKQGYTASQTLSLSVSGLTSGQSQWVLIEVTYLDVDAIRTGDPNSGVLPYFNVNSPSQPFQGVGNNGVAQNTVRQGTVYFKIAYGAPTTTGSEIPPGIDAGYIPLYLIDLNYGQSVILNNQIKVAGPNTYSGYTQAPFLAGLLNSHHGGISGQAPKINLNGATEVQGILPLANLFATNNIGQLPTIRSGTVNPQGNISGNFLDLYWNTSTNILWLCTQTGTTATAQWSAITIGITSIPNSILTGPLLSGVTAGIGIAVSNPPVSGAGTQQVSTNNVPNSVLAGPLLSGLGAGPGIAISGNPMFGIGTATVGLTDLGHLFANPGYVKLPGGIIIEWIDSSGATLNANEYNHQFQVTLPLTCPNAVLFFIPVVIGFPLAVESVAINSTSQITAYVTNPWGFQVSGYVRFLVIGN
jgi:hypothetical protein